MMLDKHFRRDTFGKAEAMNWQFHAGTVASATCSEFLLAFEKRV
jgi:hypothetical protein